MTRSTGAALLLVLLAGCVAGPDYRKPPVELPVTWKVEAPWRESRPSDRFPAIVQDVAVVGLFFVIAPVLMREHLLATSAVGAVTSMSMSTWPAKVAAARSGVSVSA